MTDNYKYLGNELELFSNVINWKNYYKRHLLKYISGKVLEVGAGLGATTEFLYNDKVKKWICLEPDVEKAGQIREQVNNCKLPQCCEVIAATIGGIDLKELFDVIIYIDVLEHIPDDKSELRFAKQHLCKQGYLIILAPAHSFLFSEFDRSIGHYRRYHKKSLQRIMPSELECIEIKYLDSMGIMASFINKVFLKNKLPTQAQLHFWDHILIPISKKLDWIFGYRLGKSVFGVWQNIN